MENFIVSARKYRPLTFDTVVGQNAITSTLKNAIKNNQLAQSFLFTGPRGVGKTTCARILAKTINCKNRTESIEPCNVCDSCKAFEASASFNIHELDAASNNSVEDIRALVEQVRIPPQSVKYKVYIIDEVHMLSQAAFNAFLKTLEEPPMYAKFILATTEKHKILPTILSRCQIFDFHRISVDDIANHLAFVAQNENISAETDALHVIAQKADGALRDALSIFDQMVSFSGNSITYEKVIESLNILDFNTYFELTDYILQGNISQSLLKLDNIYENGHDAHYFINEFGDHFRNLLVCKDPETVQLLEVSPGIKEKYKVQAQKCRSDVLIKGIEICNKADTNYKNVNNKRLLIELSLLQMCALCQAPVNTDKPFAVSQIQTHSETKPIQALKTELSPPQKPQVDILKPKKEDKKDIAKGSVSFSALMDKEESNTENKVAENIPEISKQVNIPVADFTIGQLMASWAEYAGNETLSPNFKAILDTAKLEKKENHVVEVRVLNAVQESELKQHQSGILKALQENLNNHKISLTIVVDASEADKTSKPFTVKDKFKSMSEKNPYIINLKNKLDLDFDY